jgi:hypothetical protein
MFILAILLTWSYICSSEFEVEHRRVWERRHQKRFNAIEFIHRSSEYIDLLGFIDEGRLRRQDLPPEPNPWSRTISKRVYEGSVQEWRRQIRDLATSTKLTP